MCFCSLAIACLITILLIFGTLNYQMLAKPNHHVEISSFYHELTTTNQNGTTRHRHRKGSVTFSEFITEPYQDYCWMSRSWEFVLLLRRTAITAICLLPVGSIPTRLKCLLICIIIFGVLHGIWFSLLRITM